VVVVVVVAVVVVVVVVAVVVAVVVVVVVVVLPLSLCCSRYWSWWWLWWWWWWSSSSVSALSLSSSKRSFQACNAMEPNYCALRCVTIPVCESGHCGVCERRRHGPHVRGRSRGSPPKSRAGEAARRRRHACSPVDRVFGVCFLGFLRIHLSVVLWRCDLCV
jgi:hypothetical protein